MSKQITYTREQAIDQIRAAFDAWAAEFAVGQDERDMFDAECEAAIAALTHDALREAAQAVVDAWRESSLSDPDPIEVRTAIEALVAALGADG